MSLPYHYELEWKWHAETDWHFDTWKPPSETEIRDVLAEKISKKFYDEYLSRGWKLEVGTIQTGLDKFDTQTRPHHIAGYVYKYLYDATTKVEFWTDHKAMGSPIEPATAMAILAIISGVVSLATVALYFAIFFSITSTIKDIGTGVGEALGVGGKGGLGILFLLILLLIGLYIVGKYFWRKRR